MRYEVTVEGEFAATHGVRFHDGTVEPLHEHRWQITARFATAELDADGFVVDFVAAKRDLDSILAQLDGSNLNECALMAGENPTAELVARRILETLNQTGSWSDKLVGVTTTEAPGCTATCLA